MSLRYIQICFVLPVLHGVEAVVDGGYATGVTPSVDGAFFNASTNQLAAENALRDVDSAVKAVTQDAANV